MMYTMPFKDMLILHFLIGFSLCIWAAMRAKKRDNKPPRYLFQFGDSIFGESKKWTQWFSWAITFEMITSLFYIHSGLFYYEIGMSIFEAMAVVAGGFLADRFFDLFMGDADINLPKPKIDLSGISKHFQNTMESIKQTREVKPAEDKKVAEEVKSKFDDLIKGH